ncbi:MAG: 23S rRNA (adenine(2030)-N(6))-methyltransferase RlmJ [Bauldia sp.]
MNYRHAFHAGNFADVAKHALLARLILRLQAKETAFRFIDTHAGIGVYDLAGDESSRTLEWQSGIGRLLSVDLPPRIRELLAPYLSAVRHANGGGTALRYYPGSPALVRHLLRRQDRLTVVEMHPADAALLQARFAGDIQVKAIELDGWLALPAFVPPKERRGLVFVDPPYEDRDDFDRLLAGFAKAHARWPTGVFALWYPMKDLSAVASFHARLAASGIPRIVRTEMAVRRPYAGGLFSGSGMILVNPPWQFDVEAAELLSGLAHLLALDSGAAARVDAISGEKP